MPALPGAAMISCPASSSRSARMMACSRAPEPRTRILTGSGYRIGLGRPWAAAPCDGLAQAGRRPDGSVGGATVPALARSGRRAENGPMDAARHRRRDRAGCAGHRASGRCRQRRGGRHRRRSAAPSIPRWIQNSPVGRDEPRTRRRPGRRRVRGAGRPGPRSTTAVGYTSRSCSASSRPATPVEVRVSALRRGSMHRRPVPPCGRAARPHRDGCRDVAPARHGRPALGRRPRRAASCACREIAPTSRGHLAGAVHSLSRRPCRPPCTTARAA